MLEIKASNKAEKKKKHTDTILGIEEVGEAGRDQEASRNVGALVDPDLGELGVGLALEGLGCVSVGRVVICRGARQRRDAMREKDCAKKTNMARKERV